MQKQIKSSKIPNQYNPYKSQNKYSYVAGDSKYIENKQASQELFEMTTDAL